MKSKTKRRPAAAAPGINCAHDALVSTNKLKPNPDNPNKHSDEQLDLYAKILLHQGWRKPIVVSNQSKRIVTGHGAWMTAKARRWKQVPVDYQDFPTPADEAAHMLADNQLPQMAEIDEAALAKIIEEDLPKGFDLELTAFQIGELPKELPPAPKTKSAPSITFGKSASNKPAEEIFAIQCFVNGHRKLSNSLTRRQASCFRKCAQTLASYLKREYKL